jgi:hypothetical protein
VVRSPSLAFPLSPAGRCGFHSGGPAGAPLPLASAYRPPPPPSHSLARSRNDRKATTSDVRIRLPCSRRLPASFASGPPGFHPDRPVPNRNNTVALDLSVRALLLAGAVLTRAKEHSMQEVNQVTANCKLTNNVCKRLGKASMAPQSCSLGRLPHALLAVDTI